MQEFTKLEVLSVEAKDIHVTVRVPLSCIVSFLEVMDHATIAIDESLPENQKILASFRELSSLFSSIEENIKNGG